MASERKVRQTVAARRAFEAAPSSPEWLNYQDLERLNEAYPPLASYGYSNDSYYQRGWERSQELLQSGGGKLKKCRKSLELGCWDGMVSYFLHQQGLQAHAIDLRDLGFDPRAVEAGVKFQAMDATALDFEDQTFDLVFSYSSFEHFHHADEVFKEGLRVLQPGGYFFLAFGPLYMAPTGLHAGLSVRVPYCQLLWPEATLHQFTDEIGTERIDYAHVNGWSLQRYRNLWQAYAHEVKTIRYHEIPNVRHLDLVQRYPSCFRSKTDAFEDLIVSSIFVLFQKR